MTDTPTKAGPAAEISGQLDSSSIFAGVERESLINEIVREMKRDALKQDVAAKIAKADWRKLISNFFEHPAVLLVIGFAVTAIIGSVLANRWQSREWDRQQSLQSAEWERQQVRLLDIHGVDLKYAIINEIIKAVGERNAAARGVVVPLLEEFSDEQLLKEEEEPIRNWKKVTHEWRVNAQILRLKIAAHINSEKAPEIFKQPVSKETKIGAKVNNVQKHLQQYNKVDTPDSEARQYLDTILNEIENTGEDLKQLVTVIADETQNDIKRRP